MQMRCFGCNGHGSPAPHSPGESEQDQIHNQIHSSSASSAQTSLNSAAGSPTLTINLAVQTKSFNEIWSQIHHHHTDAPAPAPADGSFYLVDGVLQPDRSSIQDALSSALFTPLTSCVSRYLDSSERTSHIFLSLRCSVEQAQSIYRPIGDLLELLSHDQLSQSQCDWAFCTFQDFDKAANPFPDAGGGFDGIRCRFSELKQQLDSRLLVARRRQRILRCATRSSAYCLLAAAAAAAVAGVVIAAHAFVALVAASGPAFCWGCGCNDLLEKQRRQLREHMWQVDAAARETYVLNNKLDSIERLVARLHAAVESDKGSVRIVLERGKGKGQRHPIQEAVRQLRKNHSSFTRQLNDLDEQIVLCLAAVNRSRSMLVQHIHCC